MAHEIKAEGDESSQGPESIRSRLSHVTFKEGRPCIKDMVETNLHESNGSVAFVSCGHPAMVDELRYFCSKMSITPKKKRVSMNKFKFGLSI